MTRLSASWIPAAALLALACAAKAAESSPPEPIAFEEIMPAEPGESSVRFSLEENRLAGDDSEPEASLYSVPRAQLFFGLADRLGCDLSCPLLARKEEGGATKAGLGDISLGLKYLLLREREWRPALSVIAELELPTGRRSDGLGEGSIGTAVSLGWLKNLARTTLQGTVGYAFSGEGEEENILYGISAAFPITSSWRLFAELTGERDLKENRDRIAAGPGLKYGLSEEAFIAAGFMAGLGETAGDRRLVTQVQFGF